MSGLSILSDNLVNDSSITITTGAANAQFPISNIKNESPSFKFRSTGNTVVLEFDLTVLTAIDTIALVGDPTGTFGITDLTAKTSVTTDFSSSTPITVDLSADHNIGFKFFTEVTHRFVELTFTGTGSFSEVSNIFIGKRVNLSEQNFSVDSFRYGYTDKSVVRKNDYGQHFINQRNQVKFLRGTIQFANLTEQETLDDLYTRHGRHEPIWLIVDELSAGINVGNFKLSAYGYMDRSPRWEPAGGQNYNSSIRLTQAI